MEYVFYLFKKLNTGKFEHLTEGKKNLTASSVILATQLEGIY